MPRYRVGRLLTLCREERWEGGRVVYFLDAMDVDMVLRIDDEWGIEGQPVQLKFNFSI